LQDEGGASLRRSAPICFPNDFAACRHGLAIAVNAIVINVKNSPGRPPPCSLRATELPMKILTIERQSRTGPYGDTHICKRWLLLGRIRIWKTRRSFYVHGV